MILSLVGDAVVVVKPVPFVFWHDCFIVRSSWYGFKTATPNNADHKLYNVKLKVSRLWLLSLSSTHYVIVNVHPICRSKSGTFAVAFHFISFHFVLFHLFYLLSAFCYLCFVTILSPIELNPRHFFFLLIYNPFTVFLCVRRTLFFLLFTIWLKHSIITTYSHLTCKINLNHLMIKHRLFNDLNGHLVNGQTNLDQWQ